MSNCAGNLKMARRKKEKEGQKGQQGCVWHSRKCTCAVAGIGVFLGATDQPICEYLLLSVCYVYEEDTGHPAKT